MFLESQRHIRDFIIETVAEAQATGRPFEICYVKELRTGYEFIEQGADYVVDGINVLSTGQGGDSRWVAVFGQYGVIPGECGFNHPKHTLLAGESVVVEDFVQYLLNDSFTMGDNTMLALGEGSDLVVK